MKAMFNQIFNLLTFFSTLITSFNGIILQHNSECVYVKSEEDVYRFQSDGFKNICGLYVISEPDYLVEFEFDQFDVTCGKGGLLSVVDGWELNGQFFPGTEDHPIPRDKRYQEYCGLVKPWKSFRTSQNVGLIEFRIPTKGEGFTVRVRFVHNPKPCNTVLQDPQGVYTLRNYGQPINCTISIIFPESFRVLALSVGTSAQNNKDDDSIAPQSLDVETGLIRKCKERGHRDYVEILGGDGLDPHLMTVAEDFCGIDSIPTKHRVDVACGNTAVRLVSSGRHDNSVTLAFDLLLDIDSPTLICPTMLEALTCKCFHSHSFPQMTFSKRYESVSTYESLNH